MGTHWLVMDHSTDTERAPYRARLAAAGRQLPQTRLTTDELMAKTSCWAASPSSRSTNIGVAPPR